eukprot:TRINITY_DN55517_c0_g1_i1.p1 TRINITY_DN55517_c0_g1~~TRINITY_DN55517_c0_g1_i1.p1  ORF type:complete len:258 (-),score=31.25 TRINITY_DN55517_c0_g1_i1:110-820(-)
MEVAGVSDARDLAIDYGDLKADSSAPPVWSRISCRRRAPVNPAASTYDELLALGRKVALKDGTTYQKMAWWSDAVLFETKARVYVLAPRGTEYESDTYVNMWNLLAYAVSEMHEHVVEQGKPFAVVWAQCSDHRMWSFSALSFKRSLHEQFGEKLEAVHVVHPSWGIRFFSLALWPVVDERFWDRFIVHERFEFLDRDMNIKKLGLPQDVVEYDIFLDNSANMVIENAGTSGIPAW